MIEIISASLSDHNALEMEINHKGKWEKTCKVNPPPSFLFP